jgi:5-methylcytosine-specific restriction protein A
MARRNPPWQRDELILALDLYFRHRPDTISKKHPEVAALSELLNKLPIHPDRPEAATFRNVNGTYMKLCNFLALDPEYQGKGLEAGGRLERDVWAEFAPDRERLARIAEAIRESYLCVEPSGVAELAEEEEFPEGRVLYRLHRLRERKPLPPEQVERRRQTAINKGLGRNLITGYHGPRWTKRQLKLLGRVPDDEVARRTGRTPNAVRVMRTKLGIPTFCDGRTREDGA